MAVIITCSASVSACAAFGEPNWNEVRQEFIAAGEKLNYEDPQPTNVEYQLHMSHNGCALYLTLEGGENKIASVQNTLTGDELSLNYPLAEKDLSAMERIGC